jgi:hypothetical protein
MSNDDSLPDSLCNVVKLELPSRSKVIKEEPLCNIYYNDVKPKPL